MTLFESLSMFAYTIAVIGVAGTVMHITTILVRQLRKEWLRLARSEEQFENELNNYEND